MMRLINQRTLTQIADEDGENVDGLERFEGIGKTGLVEPLAAVTWYIYAR